MAAPKRQDTRKFIENLSGAGKSIAVLTSGGDAQERLFLAGLLTHRLVPSSEPPWPVQPPTSPHLISSI
ncbi:ATP-dependent 6-phosphofructokinase, platelet type [Liparis tanakae]|uniref:ATP-dependent 6-phosphofructokinase, platelet type n=1 Tax=Liparis tanakae TaxID=230148 RepID=A0A4Z2HQ51_9TELE|nr:ATP-dependent 6-phosphofructokinase, platelet type [Liparis tanakae]